MGCQGGGPVAALHAEGDGGGGGGNSGGGWEHLAGECRAGWWGTGGNGKEAGRPGRVWKGEECVTLTCFLLPGRD